MQGWSVIMASVKREDRSATLRLRACLPKIGLPSRKCPTFRDTFSIVRPEMQAWRGIVALRSRAAVLPTVWGNTFLESHSMIAPNVPSSFRVTVVRVSQFLTQVALAASCLLTAADVAAASRISGPSTVALNTHVSQTIYARQLHANPAGANSGDAKDAANGSADQTKESKVPKEPKDPKDTKDPKPGKDPSEGAEDHGPSRVPPSDPGAPVSVPEPASLLLIGTGLAAYAIRRRRTRVKSETNFEHRRSRRHRASA